MIGTLFGFGGRIGRLRYFGYTFVLGIGMIVMVMMMFASALSHSAGKGASMGAAAASFLPLFLILPLFLWASLALQAKRIRDIGWNPAIVIPAWLTISAGATMLGLLGGKDGGLSMLAGALNLTMSLVLMFWPGDGRRDEDEGGRWSMPDPQVYHVPEPRPNFPRVPGGDEPRVLPSVPVRRATRPTLGPGGFGRRGLS